MCDIFCALIPKSLENRFYSILINIMERIGRSSCAETIFFKNIFWMNIPSTFPDFMHQTTSMLIFVSFLLASLDNKQQFWQTKRMIENSQKGVPALRNLETEQKTEQLGLFKINFSKYTHRKSSQEDWTLPQGQMRSLIHPSDGTDS